MGLPVPQPHLMISSHHPGSNGDGLTGQCPTPGARQRERFSRDSPLAVYLPALVVAAGCGCARPPGPARDRALADDRPRASAWVIGRESERLESPTAAGQIGDIRMENGSLVAIVSRQPPVRGFALTGGNLIDLAPVGGGEDLLNEVTLYLADEFPRQGRYRSVEVTAPGGSGPGRPPIGAAGSTSEAEVDAAVVTARGVDSREPRISIETAYILRPGAPWITIRSRFSITGTTAVRGYKVGDAIQWGRTRAIAPGVAESLAGRRVLATWLAAVGDGTSYALVADRGARFEAFSGSTWTDPIGATADLLPGHPFEYVRHVVVGRGDTASLAPSVFSILGEQPGLIAGRVHAGGKPVGNGTVHVADDAGRLVGLAATSSGGRFAIELLPGRYRVSAEAPGRTEDGERAGRVVEVGSGTPATVDLALGPRSALQWAFTGPDGAPMPIKVTVTGVGGTGDPDLGPVFRARAGRFVLSPTGTGELPLGPGHYRVFATRGPEFERFAADVEIAPGETVKLAGRLARAIDTPGFISADLHQHAAPSFDSGVSLEDRVLSNAAEGVEVLVATEHNVLVDYAPVVARLGLGRFLTSIVGTEATTHSVGHFNGLPLQLDPRSPRGGMIDPEGLAPDDIFKVLRQLGAPGIPPYVQANHPRADRRIGYFTLMGLDANTGLARDSRFSADMDGLEVVSFGHADDTEKVLADWFSLLRRGRRITGAGGSDSHTIADRDVGWPRTFVCTATDAPDRLDVAAFTAALREGCATVSGGPFLVLRSGAVRMGGLAAATAGRAAVEVAVESASWIPADRLRVFVDGRPRVTLRLPGGQTRFAIRLAVPCPHDCFILAAADGDTDLGPVLAHTAESTPRPIAVTNPIYFDADGDGVFRPGQKQAAGGSGSPGVGTHQRN